MKTLKKSMLILSVMTVIGGLGFNAMAKSSKKNIIELCSGNGGISIILREKSQAQIEMLEIQEDLVELSRRSIELNNLTGINVRNGDIKKIKLQED